MDSKKSLTATEENHGKQLGGEESTSEEIILFEFDKEQCDVVFVLEEETNTPLFCPASFLNRISKEFRNNMVKTDDGSHYEIKAEGFGVDALTKALSFYQPKYFEYFKDSDDFEDLLTICSKFALTDFQKEIESYLMNEHRLIANQRVMTANHFQFLQIAEDVGLDELYDTIMSFEVKFSFTEDIVNNNDFVGMNDDLRYEIIKRSLKSDIDSFSTNQNSAMALEVTSILHFLDLFFYDNKILDYAIHSKKSKVASSGQKNDSSSFFEKNEINDVLVKVEGKELFVNSTVLSDNSPVFKAMLNSTFKEGLENVIELPGKCAEDIKDLIISLFRAKKTTEYNALKLLPLCREYQIDWLQDLIQDQLLQQRLPSDRHRLLYLNLSHDMNFLKGEEHFVNSLSESFILLQEYKEFNDLKDEEKLLVALRRLWFIYRCICIPDTYSDDYDYDDFHEQSLDHLFHMELGLPSIFKNVINVKFEMNAREEKIISSLYNNSCTSCNGSGKAEEQWQAKASNLFGSTSVSAPIGSLFGSTSVTAQSGSPFGSTSVTAQSGQRGRRTRRY